MTVGLAPESFWLQTPRTFITVMEGKARAAEIRRDELMSVAWHSGAFSASAQAGKLKPLERYLINKPKKKMQSVDELVSRFEALAAAGKATVRRVN